MGKTNKAAASIAAGIMLLLISCSKSSEDTLTTPMPPACDTVNMTYTANVQPILQANCYSCHGNGGASGGINLDTYENVKIVAANGELIGTITHAAGHSPMPKGGSKLSDCDINIIKDWINRGMLSN